MYQMISDENELKWFFDHVIQKPSIIESYSMVFVSRHKKLTKEEQETLGLTRRESEFLAVQTLRAPKFKDGLELDDLNDKFTFEKFIRTVRRFNVDKYAYTTSKGEPLPEKTLAIIFYVNPCNDIKVVDKVIEKLDFAKTAIVTSVMNGKTLVDNAQTFQTFGNIEDSIKHCRAQCKGSVYWIDFDADVPSWFKDIYTVEGHLYYYELMLDKLNARFGKGNYIIVDTSGGYHILVRTHSIRSNPHDFCKEVEAIYKQGVADGNPEYLDEKGNCKFECIINDSQIPGLPLPGTYQYGRPVTVLNKEDFE